MKRFIRFNLFPLLWVALTLTLKAVVRKQILFTALHHSVVRSDINGEVKAVQTSNNTIYSKKAVIVAAGCWTGSLMQDLFRNWEMDLHVPVKPRKVCLYTYLSLITLWYTLFCILN